MSSWKRDTAICFAIVIIMYLFVGVVFGLVFGYFFGNTKELIRNACIAMFVISLMTIAICYFFVPKSLQLSSDEVEISEAKNPEIYARVRKMCDKAGIPMPRLYISSAPYANAWAFGKSPDKAYVCITRGLVNELNADEIDAIIGHELSHIIHRDTLVKSIARNCMQALTISAIIIGVMGMAFLGASGGGGRRGGGSDSGIVYLIIAAIAIMFLIVTAILLVTIPGASVLTKYGVSKNREYHADAGSAELTGHPENLISALRKIDKSCLEGNGDVKAA
ncbi:MAG: M48 family metalloprotease, partial [Candidatus Methanomethylophilaceae archaeon]|nr:M48 family metalloprotease [Candidatus Methanomethylophilaceae archaeon]